MASVKYRFVVCRTCGAEIDRVEYDHGVAAPAVVAVMDALQLDQDEATKLVAKQLPGAQRTSDERAGELAELIASGGVEDRPADTYACPNGHTDGAVVSDDNPTPIVSTQLAKEAAK